MKIEINDEDTVKIDGRVYVARAGEPENPKPWPQYGDAVFTLEADGDVWETNHDDVRRMMG